MWITPEGKPYGGDRVFRDGVGDAEIPERPSPRHVWQDEQWRLGCWYDWQGLKNALRGTEIFALATQSSNQNAFALLLTTFDSASPAAAKLTDLTWAIGAVRAGLPTDYSERQLEDFRVLLTQYGFPVLL